jgi:MFS family permease
MGRYISRVPAPSASNPFRPLIIHRNFRIFWSGQTLSLIGTWMQSVASGWLALQLSNSAFIVGLVSAAGSFPVLVLSLYGGVIADRYNKLKLVTIAQALLLVQALALWWFTVSNHLTIGWLLGLTTLNGLISAFEIPARQSFIVELVGREDLIDAIALNSGGFNLARIVGPSIAALVIGTLGLHWCFAFNSFSYLAVLAGLFLIRLPPWERSAQTQSSLEGLKEGFAYVRETPVVAVLIRVIGVYAIFGLPILAMMPVIARDILRTNAAGYGFLLTCVGIGALTGALSLAWLGRRVHRGKLFIISSYSFAGALIVFCLLPWHSLHIAAAVLIVIGFAMLLNGALANGLLQSIVPDELRGRVISVYILVYVGLAPIGSFLAGIAANTFGVLWAIGGGAALMLSYAGWMFSKHPELRAV